MGDHALSFLGFKTANEKRQEEYDFWKQKDAEEAKAEEQALKDLPQEPGYLDMFKSFLKAFQAYQKGDMKAVKENLLAGVSQVAGLQPEDIADVLEKNKEVIIDTAKTLGVKDAEQTFDSFTDYARETYSGEKEKGQENAVDQNQDIRNRLGLNDGAVAQLDTIKLDLNNLGAETLAAANETQLPTPDFAVNTEFKATEIENSKTFAQGAA